jgi:putative MATE family efflux protein
MRHRPEGERAVGSRRRWVRRPREAVSAGDRAILSLALPAFGALVAEPLFLVADAAIVGRLGTVPLAGLGIAGAVLATAVNLFVFLAYGTTATVARRAGAGDVRAAVAAGVDGMWLAAALGVTVALLAWPAAPGLVALFDPGPDVAAQAVTYLRWSLPGVPAMLVVLAATGVLRGLRDTRTPLLVAAAGAVLNAVLNVVLVHGAGLGIAGSAIGTAATQLLMAAAVGVVVVRAAVRLDAPLRPDRHGILSSSRAGIPLLVRTLALRAALLVTTYVATSAGAAPLAAHQVAMTLWTLLALALDALAIAAQALTGTALGAGDVAGVRSATRRMVQWGLAGGGLLGLGLLAAAPLLAPLFSPDPAVRSALVAALVVAALFQPLAGYVFVLDGVLIGAGDGTYLAVAGVLQAVLYAPLALLVGAVGPGGSAGLALLWVTFAGGYMLARAVLPRTASPFGRLAGHRLVIGG